MSSAPREHPIVIPPAGTVESGWFAERPATERLLLACARVRLDSTTRCRITNLVQAGEIDWERLSAIAGTHGVRPLVCRSLRLAVLRRMPASVVRALDREFHVSAARNLSMCGELLHTMDLLTRHGIRAIPFKGPVLAASLYDSPCLREFADLDVLIDASDARRAVEILSRCGYTHSKGATLWASNSHIGLAGPRERWSIELQWDLAARWELARFRRAPALDFEHFWSRRETINLCGRQMPALGPEDLMLLLSTHGARHCWSRLVWVCDIAELVRTRPNLDWDWLLRTAAQIRCRRRLHVALYLASTLLDANLPRFVCERMRSDMAIPEIAGQVTSRWFPHPPAPDSAARGRTHIREYAHDLDKHALFVSFHRRRQDRLRLWLRFLCARLKPTDADRNAVPLPPSLAWALYLFRPLRVAYVYGPASAAWLLKRVRAAWAGGRRNEEVEG